MTGAPALPALVTGLMLLASCSASAAPQHSHIELLSAASSLGDGQPLLLGIRIEPRAGWKTYWRSPGESGLPPVFTFAAHDNAAAPQILWPAPKRLHVQGLESYGYDGPVLFPFYLHPRDFTKPVSLEIQVDYAVCLDICVPEHAVLRLDLPPDLSDGGPALGVLQAALKKVPHIQDANSPIRMETVTVRKNGAETFLQVEAESRPGFTSPDLFVDGAPELLFSAPAISYSAGREKAGFSLKVLKLDPAQHLAGQAVILTLVDGEIAVQKQVKLAEPPKTE